MNRKPHPKAGLDDLQTMWGCNILIVTLMTGNTIKAVCLPVNTGGIVKPSTINLDAYNWVNLFAVQDLPATAKFIGFYFASFMNPRQQTCFPSLARIVSETGLSKPTVIKYLKVLEASEWIAITRQSVSVQSKGGVQAVNHYDLNIPQKVVNQINHPDEGGKILNQRWLNSDLKVVNHVNPNNNINNNNNNKRGFSPPTLQMVEQYCRERKNAVDPETFISFYASKGWMVGKTKMKDWKAAVVTWEKRERTAEPKGFQKGKYDGSDAKPGESWEAYQRRKQMEAR